MSSKQICYIVAGSFEQYRQWVDSGRPKELLGEGWRCQFVTTPNTLRGLRDIKGYYIGTYNNRSDIDEIKLIIRTSKSCPKS